MLGAYYRYLNLAGDVPDMIIVGIAYPGDSFPKGNFRGGDFTVPAESAAHYGGAEKFLSFFESELFPLVESKYQSAPDRRMLFGQSLGGQFSLVAAQTKPELFYGVIASNPALHRNLDYFIDLSEKHLPTLNRPRLFVSLAAEDDERFRIPAQRWVEHYTNQTNAGFTLKISTIQGHNHFSAAPEAFRNGLKWFFNDLK
jgi:predicted alpha/beta superfamily hydrolase